MNNKIHPGLGVKTLQGELDTDDHGAERHTPPGTWGHIQAHNHGDHWDITFSNGAWVVVTEAELADTTQYVLRQPQTLEECALALQYGNDVLQLTILDDWMMPFTQEVAGNPQQVLSLIRELNDTKQQLQSLQAATDGSAQPVEGSANASMAPAQGKAKVKTDMVFADQPGEHGMLWVNLCLLENELAKLLAASPEGTRAINGHEVWFLKEVDGELVLMHGMLDGDEPKEITSRFDFDLEWVDYGVDELQAYNRALSETITHFAPQPC
ncbi:hypothetical protein RQP54_18010 [Curvibacter sp. APW13]|uniref:hypothetical protein n=1 Tax=Curvibacter sp. APW13 TaxID=3077236 RepID=UPI0028DE7873|nr:hypothetical protein [Curvibacter sp. APW13]MDT8992773.1 hypothetical protein [Curvibacter sp. APW13]